MDHSPSDNSTREVIENQAPSGEKVSIPGDVQLLDQREARKRYGLNLYQMRQARDAGALKRYQVGGAGRWYYAEDQLNALAEAIAQARAGFVKGSLVLRAA